MELWSAVWPYIAALLPSAGMAYLGYVILRHILEADRRERAAQREWEARMARDAGNGEADFPHGRR